MVQVINGSAEINIKTINTKGVASNNKEENVLKKIIKEERRKPTDLKKDLLIRAISVNAGKSKKYLILILHHVIFDFESHKIIVNELNKLYNYYFQKKNNTEINYPLPTLPIKYTDYLLQEEKMDKTKAVKYWRDKFKGNYPEIISKNTN